MAVPRLTFLYPMLLRPLEVPRAVSRIPFRTRSVHRSRGITTTTSQLDQGQGHGGQRYGSAQEPAPHLAKDKPSDVPSTQPNPKDEPEQEPVQGEGKTSTQTNIDASESTPQTPAPEPPRIPETKTLDTILHMPSPEEEERRKPPHLKTPPYVHHFDTYGFVKDLRNSGFTEGQAVSIMKSLRGILRDNMELARAGLVSKSNVENETYLFRAACSELRTEISNNRKAETEKMRTERTQLQHEVDLLRQQLDQESATLKDNLKGQFDDRKMTVRQEQRTMDTKIQELNYKITIALNSDARSEIEGLRWVLTRRAAIAIGVSAFMLFCMLRYSSYKAHHEAEAKKKAKENAPPTNDGPPNSNIASNGLEEKEALGGEVIAGQGGISLG